MKTILYNPIFINPQAYYVFPRLTRWLRPDDSYKEPANYIGQIEVTIIAYGEIGYTEYFEHTNYIDFTNFSNSYVRISLFTRLGACVLGEWKIGTMEGDRPYIEPEVLASLKAVVIVGDKTNQDKDRDIVANLVDASNPFIISNAAYKLNSGYGLYATDFTTWTKVEGVETTSNGFRMVGEVPSAYWILFLYNTIVPSCKIRVSGIPEGGYLKYAGSVILKNGINEIPEMVVGTGASGFTRDLGTTQISDWIGLSVEQIPSYQGAFVTDGVNDLITSTKTVQEMLGGSNEITVVSLITHISGTGKYNIIGDGGIQVSDYSGQTFMAGTSSSGEKIVELGDKEKLQAVQYTTFDSKLTIGLEDSSYAYYGTFVFNKENVPVDWIHQVIAYFNLDRTLNPDILCDVKKQGITNENHAEFGDKLIDFSGNGRDIQLNNLAWKGDSGIGKYEVDFSTWSGSGIVIGNGVGFKIERETTSWWGMSAYGDTSGLGSFIIKVTNCHDLFVYRYKDEDGNWKDYPIESDGIYTLPASGAKDDKDSYRFFNSNPNATYNGLTVEQIPSHAGALCLDGVNDFGKVTGMPIYKDYTVIARYQRLVNNYDNVYGGSSLLSKSALSQRGAFLFNTRGANGIQETYSFGLSKGIPAIDDMISGIYYQSKYINNGIEINTGTAEDGTDMWLGTFRDNDSCFFNGAIYSLMTFPYSMSEFLIERQLKKHKLGTLYPDMVEFRPIVNSNVEWNIIEIWQADKPLYRPAIGTNETGTYLQKDSTIGIYVKPKGVDEVTKIVVNGTEYTNLKINSNGFYYVTLPITTSSQKIDITIDEYIRYEDIDFTDCYPGVPSIYVDDKSVTWGNKLKVGDKFTFYGNVNILPEMYNVLVKAKYNGEEMTYGSIGTITKSMAFTSFRTYTFDSNEPKCILSPSKLRIPNSSYKILGYIPDISGHGNNGVINNSAYAEGSGVNEDGSYQFDGVDDFVTIPTLSSGGKQVLMKVNWHGADDEVLYDQRNSNIQGNYDLAISTYPDTIAYNFRNEGGKTFIDGILNHNIVTNNLKSITHNITSINGYNNDIDSTVRIGRSVFSGAFSKMGLYDFMLFDEISTDEEILTLNEYVGIEGNTDDLFN